MNDMHDLINKRVLLTIESYIVLVSMQEKGSKRAKRKLLSEKPLGEQRKVFLAIILTKLEAS